MKYRLGLDLGVSSIGSAIIDDEDRKVLDLGVRIFNVSEGGAKRREKRTMRKNTVRTARRMKTLAKILFDNGLYPSDNPAGTARLRALPVYKIRTDALDKKLESLHHLGRAILHLAKHRGAGYIDQMQEARELEYDENGVAKLSKKSSPYELLEKYLVDLGARTVGEFLNLRYNDKKCVRQGRGDIDRGYVDYAIPRWRVREEFNFIWDSQAKFYDVLTPELKDKIGAVLFYENSSMPWAVGQCIYIDAEQRMPAAHPLTEQRRIYEEVNNIRILKSDGDKVALSLEQRDRVINELLMQGKAAGKKAIKELLGIKDSLTLENIIKPYLYSMPEFSGLNITGELIDFITNPINPDDLSGRNYSNDEIIRRAGKMLQTDDCNKIEKLLAMIPTGRANLGKTATNKLLELLKAGVITHRAASDCLAENDARFIAVEERARATQGKFDKLPYYGQILSSDTQPIAEHVRQRDATLNDDEKKYGKIANPAVHMILNQLRHVVNDIISLQGCRPSEICIEVARDVGLSEKQKKELEKRQKENKDGNDKAKKHLKEYGLKISKVNILKYRLADQQGWKDGYSTAGIPANFNGFEIEHLIPKTRGGTDAFANLSLVNQTDNGAKGNSFPYEYLSGKKPPEELREIIKAARSLPDNKKWRFEKDAADKMHDDGDPDESTRYLTDTRYVTKLALRYLRAILDRPTNENGIIALRGSDTAKLRHAWNLDGIEYDLMNIDVPKYDPDAPKRWIEKDTGLIMEQDEKPDIDGQWKEYKTNNPEYKSKPRMDHRHHALDAVVAAVCTRQLLLKLATDGGPDAVLLDRGAVLEKLKNISVSHKSEHGVAGQLHKETGRVVIDENTGLCYYKKKISDFKKISDLSALIIDKNHPDVEKDKELQQELYNNFYTYQNDAELRLEEMNNERLENGGKEIKISEALIIAETFKIIKERGLWSGDKFRKYEECKSLIKIPKHGVSYESGNNAMKIFWRDQSGKIKWECVNNFNANNPKFVPKWKTDGGRVLWQVCQGDMLEMNTPNEYKKFVGGAEKCRCVITKFGDANLGFVLHNDARMDSPPKSDPFYMKRALLEKGLSFFLAHKARKIELTPFGKIKRKHKALG
jgi:CRISPR-associated endonuclease Csn1